LTHACNRFFLTKAEFRRSARDEVPHFSLAAVVAGATQDQDIVLDNTRTARTISGRPPLFPARNSIPSVSALVWNVLTLDALVDKTSEEDASTNADISVKKPNH
jgi:hypothetical protein